MRNRIKTVWCYLDGKKQCDVVQWALSMNMTLKEAKKALKEIYHDFEVTFKVL